MNSPSDSFQVILAEKKHDPQMRAILEDSAFSGRIALTYLREPSVYDSFQQEGRSYIFLLMRSEEEAVGMGALTIREIVWKSRTVRLGYLSSLRIRPAYQKKFLHMAAMYQRMFEMTRHEVDLYLSTILIENEAAQRLFEKKRRSMPEYQRVAQINTYFTGYKRGTDLPEMAHYTAHTDGMPAGALPGARYLQADGAIGYTMDNVSKVYRIHHYSGLLGLLPYLPLERFGLPRFPKAGQCAHALAGAVYSGQANQEAVQSMVRALRNRAKGYDFLMIAALQGSVLDQVLSEQKGAVCYSSILYEVLFEGAPPHDLNDLAVDVALL